MELRSKNFSTKLWMFQKLQSMKILVSFLRMMKKSISTLIGTAKQKEHLSTRGRCTHKRSSSSSSSSMQQSSFHNCQCLDPDAAALCTHSLLSLKALLTDNRTDPTLCCILCTAIAQWLHTGARHVAISPPADHPFCAQLYEAITEQNIIGWDQFFKGRLSKTWGAWSVG